MTLAKHHIAQLKAILGPKGWIQSAEKMAPFLLEWRDRWQGSTPLVALPDTTRTVAKLVRYCAQHHIAITPQGGNTGLVGAQIPQGEVLLSTRRLCRILEVNPSNFTLTVEAGVTLENAKKAAHEAGLLFPLSLASGGTASIGGVLSTNAGGMEVLRYGTARELALGLEAVTPSGDIISALNGLRKDNSGYDLKQLYIGAEGTLGVITAAVLKLTPLPPVRHTVWCALNSVDDAIRLLSVFRQRYGDALSKFEIISQFCIETAQKNIPQTRAPLDQPAPWQVLAEFGLFHTLHGQDTLEQVLANAMENGLIVDAVIAQNEAQAARFLRLRESLSVAQKSEGLALKHDLSVPVSDMAKFMDQAGQEARRIIPDCRVFAFGHVGDGNVHFNVLQPVAMQAQEFAKTGPKITEALYALIQKYGGSISAEHGIGIMKKTELAAQKSPEELHLMRTLKAALDPDNIMNPRVLF